MTAWWRRNRRWLALIVPLLLLALAASSFRLVTLYLPWEWSRPTVADATAGTLRQHFTGFDGERRLREVRVEVVDVETHEYLDGCEVELTDADGTRYDFRSGQVPAEEGAYFVPPILVPCVPEDAPGPTLNPLTGEPSPSPVTRPRAWREQVLIAMPRDVTPTALRIGWSRPEYLVLRLPVT
jgi:hypothetical protein